MNVKDIVEEWLRANNYDGLYGSCYDRDPCGCSVDDLMPCNDGCQQCVSGYKKQAPKHHGGTWIIGPKDDF